MTREERKNHLMNIKRNGSLTNEERETLRLSIEELEQEPCEDAISRQAVLDYIYNDLGLGDEENGKDLERQKELESSYNYVKSLPPATPQEPTVAQERYEDLCEYFGGAKDILNSREDFKAWLGRIKWHIHKAEELYEKYEQEPKIGQWMRINYSYVFECSECGQNVMTSNICAYRYCHGCGVKMESEV